MTHFIAHRMNNRASLSNINHEYGVEIDLRDHLDGSIYLEHDPFKRGCDFEEYCKNYHNGTMILNIKSERIEYRVLEICARNKIRDYFFLDSSFPMIHSLAKENNQNIALRYSEYEGLDTIRNMAGKVQWIWVDCFTKLPLNHEVHAELMALGYKICIVSPELQAQPEKIVEYAEQLNREKIKPDAICTKLANIERWKENLENLE